MSWRDVARLTLLSHARSPWGLILLIVTLLPPLFSLLVMGIPLVASAALAGQEVLVSPLPSLKGGVGAVVAAIVLARVVLAFRGAWLTEPEGARERVPGFFAGTLGALALALLPWGLASGALLARVMPAAEAARFAAIWWAGAVLLGAAWIALLLLVCVLLEDLEARWAAAVLAWALLALAVPAAIALVHAYAASITEADVGAFGHHVPRWGLPLDALSPWRAHDLLLDASLATGYSPTGDAYRATYPLLFNPLTFAAVLLAWTAVPLALATRAQKRRDAGIPAPEVAP